MKLYQPNSNVRTLKGSMNTSMHKMMWSQLEWLGYKVACKINNGFLGLFWNSGCSNYFKSYLPVAGLSSIQGRSHPANWTCHDYISDVTSFLLNMNWNDILFFSLNIGHYIMHDKVSESIMVNRWGIDFYAKQNWCIYIKTYFYKIAWLTIKSTWAMVNY